MANVFGSLLDAILDEGDARRALCAAVEAGESIEDVARLARVFAAKVRHRQELDREQDTQYAAEKQERRWQEMLTDDKQVRLA